MLLKAKVLHSEQCGTSMARAAGLQRDARQIDGLDRTTFPACAKLSGADAKCQNNQSDALDEQEDPEDERDSERGRDRRTEQ